MLRLSEAINWNNEFVGRIPEIEYSNISIVIPVKDNQFGIDRFLDLFFESHSISTFPLEIIIVDNNSTKSITLNERFWGKGLKIKICFCHQPGPAAARNTGALKAMGKWLLFCDSDCIPTSKLIAGYISSKKMAIAYTGHVEASENTWLTYFYNTERILLPHLKPNQNNELVPLYIVTANTLVWKTALIESGGFHEGFHDAAGEDVELSIRLWKYGNICHINDSLILHDFSKGLLGFCKRFIRYGRGNRQLEEIQHITMRPIFRKPNKITFSNYSAKLLQHICMSIGYHLERRKSSNGKYN